MTAELSGPGTVAERYVYTPYGTVECLDANWANGQADPRNANPILFCGYHRDAESGLYHVRNRMYDVSLGRWLQRDPAGYVDGLSLYGYADGDPCSTTDPTGNDTCEVVRKEYPERSYKAADIPDPASFRAGQGGLGVAPAMGIYFRRYQILWRCCKAGDTEAKYFWTNDFESAYVVDHKHQGTAIQLTVLIPIPLPYGATLNLGDLLGLKSPPIWEKGSPPRCTKGPGKRSWKDADGSLNLPAGYRKGDVSCEGGNEPARPALPPWPGGRPPRTVVPTN